MVKKKYECNHCGTMVVVRSKGLCARCRSKTLKPKARKPIKKKTKPKKKSLAPFFKEAVNTASRHAYSEESNTYIPSVSVMNIAHIFPKRKYKSIADHPLNWVLLTHGEHSKFDFLLDSREARKLQEQYPNVLKIIALKLPTLLECITERGGSLVSFLQDITVNDYTKD